MCADGDRSGLCDSVKMMLGLEVVCPMRIPGFHVEIHCAPSTLHSL